MVYMDKPGTIEQPEANITRVIRQIPIEMLGRIIENWICRMDQFNRSYGQYFKEIMFKK